jgi:hypothetical protein
MRARSSGSESSGKDAAFLAALLTERSRIARWALVDDGGLRQTAVQAELELVGRTLTQTEATLAAGIRAVGFAASSWEAAPARYAYTLLVCRPPIVTQRDCPSLVVAGVGASTRQ